MTLFAPRELILLGFDCHSTGSRVLACWDRCRCPGLGKSSALKVLGSTIGIATLAIA